MVLRAAAREKRFFPPVDDDGPTRANLSRLLHLLTLPVAAGAATSTAARVGVSAAARRVGVGGRADCVRVVVRERE